MERNDINESKGMKNTEFWLREAGGWVGGSYIW